MVRVVPRRTTVRVAKAIGTGPIGRIVLVKNNEIFCSIEPQTKEAEFAYRDDAVRGESYYYIRVEQADGSLAWASPIWVAYR